jgi:hypothetical protein
MALIHTGNEHFFGAAWIEGFLYIEISKESNSCVLLISHSVWNRGI